LLLYSSHLALGVFQLSGHFTSSTRPHQVFLAPLSGIEEEEAPTSNTCSPINLAPSNIRLLFVYDVQLYQLTPNSLLHIACFITLCEAFLGIEPHWVLWKYLFLLRPSGSKGKIPELGGAIVSVRSESQYLDFKMAQSVQGWRHKWFYIKDQKSAESDKYGLPPFDASKILTKLTTCDALPSNTVSRKHQTIVGSYPGAQECSREGADWNTTDGVFSFSDVFNRCKLEFLNYGLTPAQMILLECLQRTQRKRILRRG
jgi:hypothetical protein